MHLAKYFEDIEMKQDYSWWKHISNAGKKTFIKNCSKFNKDGFFSNELTSRLNV